MSPEVQAAIVAALGGFDRPLLLVEPHPFRYIDRMPCCARCGGGIQHEIHAVPGFGAQTPRPESTFVARRAV